MGGIIGCNEKVWFVFGSSSKCVFSIREYCFKSKYGNSCCWMETSVEGSASTCTESTSDSVDEVLTPNRKTTDPSIELPNSGKLEHCLEISHQLVDRSD